MTLKRQWIEGPYLAYLGRSGQVATSRKGLDSAGRHPKQTRRIMATNALHARAISAWRNRAAARGIIWPPEWK